MPQTILVLVSNPVQTGVLNLPQELRRLQEAIQRSQHRHRFRVEFRFAASPTDLRRHLIDTQPQIVHFCGHGTRQGLLMDNATGEAELATNEFLTELLKPFANRIDCVVLNACETEPLVKALAQHLNVVIGMNRAVRDDAAIAFAEAFYDALGGGETYESAFEIGEAAMGLTDSRWTPDRKAEVVDPPVQSEQPEHQILVLEINPNPTPIQQPEPADAEQSSSPAPKRFTVPYERNVYFTGREAILTELHQTLGQTGAAALSQAKAIHGLGGVGKTQTAVEYAYRYFYDQPVYNWVLWVNASNLTLAASFGSIAADLALPNHETQKLDENIAAAARWLETHDDWLLIFDNVDDPQTVQPFRPKNPKGRILITSRTQRLESLGVGSAVELNTLEPEEAHAFLLRRTGWGESPLNPPQVGDCEGSEVLSSSQAENANGSEVPHLWGVGGPEAEAIVTLAQTLGYLPLALEQAAAYILAKQVSFAAYLGSYQKRRLQLLEKAKPQTGHYPNSVATTWAINFEAVNASNPAAADLLRLSAFLAPDNIPYEILRLGKDHLGELLRTALADAEADELVLPELLEELTRYSLIRLETEDRYSIHRLVQEVLRDALPLEQQSQWINRAVAALNATFPNPEFQNWQRCERLVKQVQAIDPRQATKTVELAWLLISTGDYLRDQGRYSEAEPLYLQALPIYRTQLGEEHLATANSLNNLALLYQSQGRYGEAEPLYLQALPIYRTQLGENHPNTASSLNNLAALYKSQGRYGEAEPLYLQALAIRRTQLGEDHPDTATSLNNLAELYHSQGRYGEAELLYLQALAIYRTQLGEDHPNTVNSLNNLAELYRFQGRYSEAEPLYLQALAIYRTQLGEDHPTTASSLNNLAGLYEFQGRYGEAELLYLQALEIKRIQLGENHPATATSLNNLALLYKSQGRYDEAEPLLLQGLAITRTQLGEDHPTTASSLNNLAGLYEFQGRYGEAELLYLQALEIKRTQLGENHPNTASSLNNLAALYESQGRYGEAELLYLQTLAILLQKLGENHSNTQTTWSNFVHLLQQAITAGQTGQLSDHPVTQRLLTKLQAERQ